MHRVTSSLTVGSIGDLGRIAGALAGAGYNIDAIGGGEARVNGQGVGIITMLITPDEDTDAIRAIIEGVELSGDPPRRVEDLTFQHSFDLVLDDQPGTLAGAAGIIGNAGINILGVLSVDVHSGWGVVSLGFATEGDRDSAHALLGQNDYETLPEHGGRDWRAWVDERVGDERPPA